MPRRNYLISISHTFEIQSNNTYIGTDFIVYALFDGNILSSGVTWEITAGNNYAVIDPSIGYVTIDPLANNSQITISASYNNYTDSKNVIVTYENIQHSFYIYGATDVHGTSGNVFAIFDGQDVTLDTNWDIHAEPDGIIQYNEPFDGNYNILEGGHVTFNAEYQGYNYTLEAEVHYEPESSTHSEVIIDPETGSITTETTITNGDGSSQTTSTTENQDGTSSQSETNTASDGSSSTTTTNYDANGDPTSGSNNTVDTQGNSNTQTIEYDAQGNTTVTGYVIDTSGNTSTGSEPITTGLDTGVIVFDGHDWEADLTFKVSNYLSITNNPFFSAMYKENNKANGIVVYSFKNYGGTHYNETDTAITGSTSSNPVMRMKINEWVNGSIQSDSYEFYSKHTTAYSSYRFGTRTSPLTLTLKASCTGNTLTVELYYNNQITAKPRYSKTYTFNATNKGVTFKLGEMTTNSTTVYAQNFEVISFNVQKI